MQRAFTLIELSIVLVIIGLIVGGILVGRNLIDAAAVRSQIAQIDKFNTAANTFKGKYGYLPGDIIPTAATQFGFLARNGSYGQGDGNGVLQANVGCFDDPGYAVGDAIGYGEGGVFWNDLSTAGLVEGKYKGTMSCPGPVSPVGTLPPAAIGNGNYVGVWSGGWAAANNQLNYFSITPVTGLSNPAGGPPMLGENYAGMTVAQAYAMDTKLDDGLPQTGRVIAFYPATCCMGGSWMPAGAGSNGGAWNTAATPWASTNCFDNNNVNNATQQYSMSRNASMVNCGLSIELQ